MIKPAKLAILFVLIVLFSGCTDTPTEDTTTSAANGVDFDIYADTLQAKQYEGQTFGFQVLAENEGSYNIPQTHFKLFLEGINPLTYGLTVEDFIKENTLELTSIGIYNDELSIRGQEVFSFENLCYRNDLDSNLKLDMHLRSCYSYETSAKVGACFGEAYSQFNEICTVTESKTVTNSISPVKVTEIYESGAGGDDYRFIVKVTNQGDGKVFSRYATARDNPTTSLDITISNSMKSCTDLSPGLNDMVYVESIKLDGAELLGTAELVLETKLTDANVASNNPNKGNYFNLVDGKGQFIFKLTEVTDVDYVGTLEIVLGYGYTETTVRNTELIALPDVVPEC